MKYYGKIGFWVDDVEIRPSVFRSQIVEKSYAGDVLDNRQRWNQSGYQNDNLTVNNKISIIADMYLNQHISSIKYVTFMDAKWKVSSIDIKYPRVILELGEVYDGINAE